jgi:hypothetical protein
MLLCLYCIFTSGTVAFLMLPSFFFTLVGCPVLWDCVTRNVCRNSTQAHTSGAIQKSLNREKNWPWAGAMEVWTIFRGELPWLLAYLCFRGFSRLSWRTSRNGCAHAGRVEISLIAANITPQKSDYHGGLRVHSSYSLTALLLFSWKNTWTNSGVSWRFCQIPEYFPWTN